MDPGKSRAEGGRRRRLLAGDGVAGRAANAYVDVAVQGEDRHAQNPVVGVDMEGRDLRGIGAAEHLFRLAELDDYLQRFEMFVNDRIGRTAKDIDPDDPGGGHAGGSSQAADSAWLCSHGRAGPRFRANPPALIPVHVHRAPATRRPGSHRDG